MDNVELLIVENAGSVAKATSYYSRSQTTPHQESSTLTMVYSLVNSSGIYATFTRPLTGNPSGAANIQVGSNFKLGIAYLSRSTTSFSKHNSVTKGNIVMGATNATSSFSFGGSDSIDLDYYRDHGIYMTVMWVGVIEMAIIMMRYFKWWRFSGLFHALLGTTALVTTLVSAYKTYKKDKVPYSALDAEDEDFLYHSRIAFTMCSLTLSQFLLGIFFKYTQIFKKNIKINNFSRLVHRILGWTLPFMALWNVKFGWHLHGQTWKNREYIYPAYGVLFAVLFLFELNFKFGKLIRKNFGNFKLVVNDYYRGGNSGQRERLVENDKIDRRRHCEVFEEIMNGKKEWVFYDEYILDISGFKWNHPGGSFMFKGIYGQDVGKFLNGCSNVDDYRPYFHSDQARNIAEHLTIGYISFPPNLFVSLHNNETNSNMSWTLTNRTTVAQSTYCLEFSSFNWQITAEPPGFEWIGKHFLVTSLISGKIINRYYSFVHVNLQTWADEVRSHSMKAKHYDVKQEPNKLRLHIKHYPGGEMTSHLSSIPLGSIIQFKGPIGPGICTDTLKDKEFLVFGAGTGVLPFLDLIYAVWKGRASNCVLHMYISFRDEASSFAVDLIEATAKVFPRNIKLYSRIGQKGYELNSEFWRNMLPLHLAEKAWVCGPPVFNRKIEKILIDEGFNPGKIIML